MPEPFKNFLNIELVKQSAKHLQNAWPDFDNAAFVAKVASKLEQLELKQRSHWIKDCLIAYLPNDFTQQLDILQRSLSQPYPDENLTLTVNDSGIAGWMIMPMADLVTEQYFALSNPSKAKFDLSLQTLREMTRRSSSEFAIRPFIDTHPTETLAIMAQWAKDTCPHVRRLASEGSRPRLPWGMRLNALVNNPEPLRGILEALKHDNSEYVRRSVANSLNDIAKDHPQWVVDLCRQWQAQSVNPRLIKHACRTLLKQGHSNTLALFGFSAPRYHDASLTMATPNIAIGDKVDMHLEITAEAAQEWMIDFAVHYQKANGSISAKVFKWRQVEVTARQTLILSKAIDFKPISTRKYYPGEHKVEVLINGQPVTNAKLAVETCPPQ